MGVPARCRACSSRTPTRSSIRPPAPGRDGTGDGETGLAGVHAGRRARIGMPGGLPPLVRGGMGTFALAGPSDLVLPAAVAWGPVAAWAGAGASLLSSLVAILIVLGL